MVGLALDLVDSLPLDFIVGHESSHFRQLLVALFDLQSAREE